MTGIRFLKHSIKAGGKTVRVHYSTGGYTNFPSETITIYAKDYGAKLPKELSPENDTDSREDYFEKDRARIIPGSKYYEKVREAMKGNG